MKKFSVSLTDCINNEIKDPEYAFALTCGACDPWLNDPAKDTHELDLFYRDNM